MVTEPQRSVDAPLSTSLPHPPAHMPLLRDRRPRKRWTYVGLFSEELMLCAANVEIGPFPQCFWAFLERGSGRLTDGTSFSSRPVGIQEPRGGVGRLDLAVGTERASLMLEPAGDPVAVISPHGRSYIWTRKTPVRARGTVTVAGELRQLEARGLVDESAGYHARSTGWSWSCGIGADREGREVTWNVVAGIHDDARGSERTVWVDGSATELPGALFDAPLETITFPGSPATLHFTAEAERARRDDFGVMMSDYRQPFGSFDGSLPGVELAWGLGVMERHDVRW